MNVSATTIYSETYGDGPDLVLLHGWGFNLNIWSPIVCELQKHFRLTLIDLPGFGRSKTIAASHTLTAIVDAISHVIPQKAIYIAWSLGSLVALRLAIDKPQHLSQLISVCASPRFLATDNWPGISADLLQQFSHGVAHHRQKTLNKFARMLSLSDSKPKQLSQLLSEKILEHGIAERQVLLAGLQILADNDLRAQCSSLHCPQSYILGGQDPLLPRETAIAIKQMFPASDIKQIDDAGHVPFLTHSQQFLQHIYQLIQL